MKSKFIVAGAIAGFFVLAGCTGQELHKAQLMDPQGSEFNQNLYHGYIGLSEAEYAEGDYYDSDVFAGATSVPRQSRNVDCLAITSPSCRKPAPG
jgi:hypothetical protein